MIGSAYNRLGARKPRVGWMVVAMVATALALVGCGPFGGDSQSNTSTGPQTVKLSDVSWCDRPILQFQDDATTNQTVLTAWSKVSGQLGFTPYLPQTMPKGTCLVLAGGSIHDPIYGGHLSITYQLPDTGSLSFSEAPKHPSLGNATQCSQDTQNKDTTVCLGTMGNTSITIAARQTPAQLQALFKSLQPNVPWLPSGTEKLLATPTTAPTVAPTATTKAGG